MIQTKSKKQKKEEATRKAEEQSVIDGLQSGPEKRAKEEEKAKQEAAEQGARNALQTDSEKRAKEAEKAKQKAEEQRAKDWFKSSPEPKSGENQGKTNPANPKSSRLLKENETSPVLNAFFQRGGWALNAGKSLFGDYFFSGFMRLQWVMESSGLSVSTWQNGDYKMPDLNYNFPQLCQGVKNRSGGNKADPPSVPAPDGKGNKADPPSVPTPDGKGNEADPPSVPTPDNIGNQTPPKKPYVRETDPEKIKAGREEKKRREKERKEMGRRKAANRKYEGWLEGNKMGKVGKATRKFNKAGEKFQSWVGRHSKLLKRMSKINFCPNVTEISASPIGLALTLAVRPLKESTIDQVGGLKDLTQNLNVPDCFQKWEWPYFGTNWSYPPFFLPAWDKGTTHLFGAGALHPTLTKEIEGKVLKQFRQWNMCILGLDPLDRIPIPWPPFLIPPFPIPIWYARTVSNKYGYNFQPLKSFDHTANNGEGEMVEDTNEYDPEEIVNGAPNLYCLEHYAKKASHFYSSYDEFVKDLPNRMINLPSG
ncbi:hypothetical protein HYY75_03360, partial [bacterium]|nr:hypothetical protein [bacterium]